MQSLEAKEAINYIIENLELEVVVDAEGNYTKNQSVTVRVKIKDKVIAQCSDTIYIE